MDWLELHCSASSGPSSAEAENGNSSEILRGRVRSVPSRAHVFSVLPGFQSDICYNTSRSLQCDRTGVCPSSLRRGADRRVSQPPSECYFELRARPPLRCDRLGMGPAYCNLANSFRVRSRELMCHFLEMMPSLRRFFSRLSPSWSFSAARGLFVF